MRALVLSVLLAAGVAHANGRSPLTNGIFFRPGDSHSLYLRTTFGLQISHDDGCTFDWICEDNIGYGGSYDPRFAIAADGTIFATSYNGLRVSRDGGCSFTTATAVAYVAGLDLATNGDVWIGTATTPGSNDVFHSTDNGATFTPVGLATQMGVFTTVRVAPSDPARIYAAGYEQAGTNPPVMKLYRSDNTGGMWTSEPLTGVAGAPEPELAVSAIDPVHEDIVFLASKGANQPAGDKLYRSDDGGVSFSEVLATDDELRDVVIVDATHVLVSTAIVSMQGEMGGPAYASTDGGKTFAPLSTGPQQLDCLGLRGDGALVGCAANWDPDFKAVAISTDVGATWSKLWRFTNMAGPLSCPAGTAEHDTCAAMQWPMVSTQFAPVGPVCGAAASGDAGMTPAKPEKAGCCDAGGGAASSCLVVCVLAVWLRRRR